MTNYYKIKSVSEVHTLFGLEQPKHPLITIIRKWPQMNSEYEEVKVCRELYLLSMKGRMKSKTFQYGKNSYDFEDGTLVFIAPNQVTSFSDPIEELDDSMYMKSYHPAGCYASYTNRCPK